MKRRVGYSLLLAFATTQLVSAALKWLPTSETRDSITDAISLPAGAVAGLLFPQGVHGDHVVAYVVFTLIANLLILAAFWFGVLTLYSYLKSVLQRS